MLYLLQPVPQSADNLYNGLQPPPFPSSSISSDPYSNSHPYSNYSTQPGLENPFVLATLISGLIGITLSIIIILSIWILKKSRPNKKGKKGPSRNSAFDIEKNEAEIKNSSKSSHNNSNVNGSAINANVISEIKQRNEQVKAGVGPPNTTATANSPSVQENKLPPSPPKRNNILSKKIKNLRLSKSKTPSAGSSVCPNSVPELPKEPSPGPITSVVPTQTIETPPQPPPSTRILKETFGKL